MRLNEGLEELGEKEVSGWNPWAGGIFWGSAIETIKLPSTMKIIGIDTFYKCENLKRIEVPNGVECIGRECFRSSGIEEITLPSTLKEMGEDAFRDCENLKTVLVGKGCTVDIKKYVGNSVEVRFK